MPGKIGFEINLGAARDPRSGVPRRRQTMQVLVLADLSGRRNRGVETTSDLASRPVLRLDLDNFGAMMRRLSPVLVLGGAGNGRTGLSIAFESLDDFHPDRLYASLQPFQSLRASRSRLLDPATSEAEASRLMENPPESLAGTAAAADSEPASPEDRAGLMQRLLGTPAGPEENTRPPQGIVDDLIRRVVQPHIQPGHRRSPDPYVAAIDASLGELMRSLLHDPDFQALEATWRGVRSWVDELDLDADLSLHVVDVSKGELLADLESCQGRLEESSTCRLLTETSRAGADDPSWSLLVGHYQFGASSDDIALLGHLGVLASRAGGPLLAAAEPGLVGCRRLGEDTESRHWQFEDPQVEQRWLALRRSTAAQWLGLALPRILLRLPYGAKTDRIDGFAFEECGPAAGHDDYLWGNPALACARMIAGAFLEESSDIVLGGPFDIEDLPAHVRDVDGERRLQPCAEFALPMRTGEELLRRGMIALLSYGNRNAVRVMGVQSVADPPAPLARLG
jgi:type VI secretion system protein ImpC